MEQKEKDEDIHNSDKTIDHVHFKNNCNKEKYLIWFEKKVIRMILDLNINEKIEEALASSRHSKIN